MATFEAGAIPSSFGNVLYDPMGVDQAVRANQRNDLMMAGERQKQAAGGQEQIGRAAAWVAGLPADQQPAAYDAAVRQLSGAGLLPNGAPAYPGAEALRGLAQRTLPVEMQYQLGLITSPALDAALKSIYGPGGAPGGAAPAASGSGAIPSGGGKPFVYPNLPQGVTPDEDQMVRTVYGEARGEPLAGQQAVAHVVQNRVKGGGGSISDVVFAPNQFEPWNNPTTRAQLEALDPNSADYQRILTQAVRPVMAGQAQDPTGGATHFVSPTAQAALGRQMPAWATGSRTTIGLHDFYYPGYSGQPAPQQANGAPATPAPYRVAGPTVAPPSSGAPSGPAPGSTAPAPAPAAQGAAQGAAQTGLNSPQVQQAQKLQQQATQIEMMPGAAFDPRAKAAVADLRARALLLMQADSYQEGYNATGEHGQRSQLTNKFETDPTQRTLRLPDGRVIDSQGKVLTTTTSDAQVEEDKKDAGRLSELRKETLDTAQTAGTTSTMIANTERAMEEAQKGNIGPGAMAPEKLKLLAIAKAFHIPLPFGLDESKLAAGQVTREQLAQMNGMLLKRMFPQRITNVDMATVGSALPNYGLDPAAIVANFDIYKQQAEYDQTKAKDMLAYEHAHGSLKGWENDWYNRHGFASGPLDKLFNDVQREGGQTATAAPVTVKSDADFHALPSGAEFIDPNGQKRRKP